MCREGRVLGEMLKGVPYAFGETGITLRWRLKVEG
jgi:hypothetical protein